MIVKAISLMVDPVVTISSIMIIFLYQKNDLSLITTKLPAILTSLSSLVSFVCDGVYFIFLTNCTQGIPSLLPNDFARSSD